MVGRKLDTDVDMVLKDYGKTKFFSNPLQPTEKQIEGVHHIRDVDEILISRSPVKTKA